MNNYTFEANYWGDFEWGNVPPHDGHPIELTKEKLDAWIGKEGQTIRLAESGCFGKAYFNTYTK
jgi:hypothetical protein